jgi:hypothetical protein
MEDVTEFLEFVRIAPFQINAVDLILQRNISCPSIFKFLGGGTDGIQINLLLSK